MYHIWGRKMHRSLGNLNDGDHFQDLGVDGEIILKQILKK
jgi:hypothetical protein